MIIPYIERYVNEPYNEHIASCIAEGSNLAGRAINIANTTAAHSVSYPITSYFGVPHGQAVAITLPEFIKFNSEITEEDILDKRGVEYVKGVMRELYQLR